MPGADGSTFRGVAMFNAKIQTFLATALSVFAMAAYENGGGFEVPVVPIEVPKGRLLQGQLVDPDNKPLAHWTVITQRSRAETDADGKFRVILRHNERPSDWKTYSPENSRGVPKVISESPLLLQITDFFSPINQALKKSAVKKALRHFFNNFKN